MTAHDDAADADAVDAASKLPPKDCEEVIGHVEGFLSSDQTQADEQELRESVANTAPELADMSVEALIRTIIKRSCCETAPETLRIRIRTQLTVWRTGG